MSFQTSKWLGGAATGVLLSAGIVLVRGQVTKTKAGPGRSFVASRFALDLDKTNVGFMRSVEGGFPKAIVVEQRGPDSTTKKHVASVQYQEVVLQAMPTASKLLFDWVNLSWQSNVTRKNGAILGASFDLRETSRLEFYNALITETSFPTLDGSDKNPGFFTIKLAPERTEVKNGSGVLLGGPDTKGKVWLPSNFRFEIAGLDCSRVSKIEGFSVRQSTGQDALGAARTPTRTPGRLEFPNIVFYVPEAFAKPFYDWFEDFVIRGNNGDEKERSGKLFFLDQTRQDSLLQIGLYNLGIVSVSPEKAEANVERIRRVRVEMYCEKMDISVGK